jgi:DNA cross-link repair 1B protein
MICEIIENHREHRVLICVDSVGKEELMVQLAEKFETVVVVSQQRFEMIQSINLRPELFSTNHDDGWIEVISKFQREERLKNKNCIAITATGWANITGYQMPDKQNFVIPYSLHSNFDEMHQFVRTIKPAILSKVVINRSGKSDKIRNLTSFSHYMVTLHHLKQRVLSATYLPLGI